MAASEDVSIASDDLAANKTNSTSALARTHVLPLTKRRMDWPILLFFVLNLVLITYVVDLEQHDMTEKQPSTIMRLQPDGRFEFLRR